jgi:hypothetical protein
VTFDHDAFEWIGDDPREVATEGGTDETAGRSWEEARPEFLALIDKTFSQTSLPTLP